MGFDPGTTRPEQTQAARQQPYQPQQTVWQHDDPAIQRLGGNPPATHWSTQITQPLGPRWPAQMRRRLAAQRAAQVARRESRAVRRGAGCGIVLTLLALGVLLLLAAASGWFPGGSAAPSDAPQFPIPVQMTPHSIHAPLPGATTIPTSTALPTATPQATATSLPTATPLPTTTPATTPQPTATPATTGTP